MQAGQKQVGKEHYDFDKYIDEYRWSSYYLQIKNVMRKDIKKVLIIGVGDGIVPNIIKILNSQINVVTFDFAQDLKPDICGDVRKLSLIVTEQFDAIICCQVLEHLPFEEFEKCISEISKCLLPSGRLILSLPDSGIELCLQIHIPKIMHTDVQSKFCRWYKKDFEFNGEHYWEVNSAGKYNEKNVNIILNKYYEILSNNVVKNNVYHRFYILKRKLNSL